MSTEPNARTAEVPSVIREAITKHFDALQSIVSAPAGGLGDAIAAVNSTWATVEETIAAHAEAAAKKPMIVLSDDERFALIQAYCLLGAVAQDDADPREALDSRMSAFQAMQHLESIRLRFTEPTQEASRGDDA